MVIFTGAVCNSFFHVPRIMPFWHSWHFENRKQNISVKKKNPFPSTAANTLPVTGYCKNDSKKLGGNEPFLYKLKSNCTRSQNWKQPVIVLEASRVGSSGVRDKEEHWLCALRTAEQVSLQTAIPEGRKSKSRKIPYSLQLSCGNPWNTQHWGYKHR